MQGKVHSIESFATLDGGGIRYAIFLQGCPLRCIYCHNVDTQPFVNARLMSVEQLADDIYSKRSFYRKGGVTISGGEPLAQSEFVEKLINSIHDKVGLEVAIDTSLAIEPKNFARLIEIVDLFIVDIKFWDSESYKKYCGGDLSTVLRLLEQIDKSGKRILLRTVIVPNINDNIEIINKYLSLIDCYTSIEGYELLGYHTLGRYKYKDMGIDYPLEGIPAMDKVALDKLQQHVNERRWKN